MMAILVGVVLLSLSGVTMQYAFDQPTLLKYGLTVAGPLVLLGIVSASRPLDIAVPLMIVSAPLAPYSATFLGQEISVLMAVVVLALVTGLFSGETPITESRKTSLTSAGLLVVALFVCFRAASMSHFVTWLAYGLAIGLLTKRVAESRRGLYLVLGAMVASASIQAALALVELKTKHAIGLYAASGADTTINDNYFFGYGDTFRPTALLYDPISLGNLLAIAVPIAFVLALRISNPRQAALMVLPGGLILVGLLATLSRMSWLAAVAGLVMVLLIKPGASRRRISVVLGSIVVGGTVAAFVVGGSDFFLRLSSIGDPTGAGVETASGDEDRLAYWSAAWSTFVDHPVFGVGPGHLLPFLTAKAPNVAEYTHAHSTYLQTAAEAGLLGLVALTTFLSRCWSRLFESMDPLRRAAIGGALAALLVAWMTDYTIRYEAVLAFMTPIFGLCFASRNARESV